MLYNVHACIHIGWLRCSNNAILNHAWQLLVHIEVILINASHITSAARPCSLTYAASIVNSSRESEYWQLKRDFMNIKLINLHQLNSFCLHIKHTKVFSPFQSSVSLRISIETFCSGNNGTKNNNNNTSISFPNQFRFESHHNTWLACVRVGDVLDEVRSMKIEDAQQ